MHAPSSASIDRAVVARAGLPAFCELWGRRKFGTKYINAWHMRLMAEHAEALYYGRILTLLCSVMPGAMKSFVFSRCFPAWIWAQDPSFSIMRASYLETVAARFGSDTREICESRWFRDRWGDVILGKHPLRPSGVGEYWTTAGGFCMCASVGGGKLTGAHAPLMLIDDPIKGQSALAKEPKLLEQIHAWFDTVATMRGGLGDVQRVLCVAQRFHEHDLNGMIAEKYAGFDDFAHLCLPYHFERERACVTSIGRDPRTKEGEILFEDKQVARKVAHSMIHGPLSPVYRSQMQQDPKSSAARYFPAETLLDFAGAPAFRDCPITLISIDPTFTGKARSDLMAIDVWGYSEGHFWCYYAEQARRDFASTPGKEGALDAIRRVLSLYPATIVLVEETANGAAILSMLKNEIVGLTPIKPMGHKEERAFAASKFFHAGRVHFDKSAPWFAEKARFLVRFPTPGENDDPVDTVSQAINYIEREFGGGKVFDAAMRGLDADAQAERVEREKREQARPTGVAGQMRDAMRALLEGSKHPVALEGVVSLNYGMLDEAVW